MSPRPPVTILGVSESHCATACLLRDGQVVACVSEERLNRQKNWSGFPALAAREVLRIGGAEPGEVDALVLHGRSPWMYGWYGGENRATSGGRRLMAVREGLGVGLAHLPAAWPAYRLLRDRLYRARVHERWNHERLQLASEQSWVPAERIVCADHHACHAYAGLHGVLGRPSGPYLVLTNDGHGDDCCSTVSIYDGGAWRRLASTANEHSLADVYMTVTRYLGMTPDEHEYKVMGLAPYAPAADVERALARLRPLVWRSGLSFDSLVPDQAYYHYLRAHLEGQRFDWIAGAVQQLTEELVCAWVAEAVRRTGLRRVVLSGGIFLNVKANMAIAALPDVETLAICPSPGDDSTAIGAAYWGYERECRRRELACEPQALTDLYLGPEYGEAEIAGSIARWHGRGPAFEVERPACMAGRIADLLAAGQVVARFAGRMEFGARALGNRSILASPADAAVVGVLNRQIKSRDFWMPFAGTVLHERQHDYLDNPKGLRAPYMVLAFASTPRAQRDLAAAMHPADHTMRPQVLDRATNAAYYDVVEQFEARTGIGGVLNTSFNLHGEPIVCSPDDALSTFGRSGLRHLALGDFLLSKPDAAPHDVPCPRGSADMVDGAGTLRPVTA